MTRDDYSQLIASEHAFGKSLTALDYLGQHPVPGSQQPGNAAHQFTAITRLIE